MQTVLLGLLPTNDFSEQSQDDPLFRGVLHPTEATILSGYRLPKRRSEYLTGRICAKLAIQDFYKLNQTQAAVLNLPEIEIANSANGRPNALVHTPNVDALKMDISISHSGDYVVALAAQLKCGIDLQQQKPALLRVQEKYCTEAELDLLETFLAGSDTVTSLTLLWAAKEAAKKALSQWQMPGFLELELRETKKLTSCNVLYFRLTHTKSHQMPQKVIVMTGMFYDYALAICLVGEDYIDAGIARS